MTRWVGILTLASDDVPASVRATGGQCGRHAPGSVGPGDATWDLELADAVASPHDVPKVAAALADDVVTGHEFVALDPVRTKRVGAGGAVVKRTLLFSVLPDAPSESVAALENHLTTMPAHIPAIGSWTLSRVASATGDTAWTHVWEQEFANTDGVNADYLLHPYHWTLVDAWFDPENPRSIVHPYLAHVFYEAPRPVI